MLEKADQADHHERVRERESEGRQFPINENSPDPPLFLIGLSLILDPKLKQKLLKVFHSSIHSPPPETKSTKSVSLDDTKVNRSDQWHLPSNFNGT